MEDEWRRWVLSHVDTHKSVPVTGSILLSILGSFALPTIQRMALNYGLQQLSQGLTQMSMASVQHFLSSIISLPFQMRNASVARPVDIDTAIFSNMLKGEKIISTGDFFAEINESKQIVMILLVTVLSMYFQYKGMDIMNSENEKYQKITAMIDEDTDISDESWIRLNTKIKKYIFSKYNTSSSYNPAVQDGGPMSIKDYDPVRIVYNTLVGINHSLFYVMGGRSDDPVHEIVHWTKVLFYWEILARLLGRYGLGPMRIASELFLHDIWSKKMSK
jgi:hypothetical protein